MPDLLLELFSEEIPARMQRQAAEDLKKLVTNALVDAGLVYEGAQAFATPRRLALHVVGLPGGAGGPARGAQGAARRRARSGRRGLSQERGAGEPRSGAKGFGRQEGRDLCRRDREEGPPDAGVDRRTAAADPARLPVAEVDALGRGFDQAGRAALGAAAALDPLPVRPRARGDRDRAVRARRARLGRRDLRPSLPRAGADQGAAVRGLRRGAAEGQGRARRGAAAAR